MISDTAKYRRLWRNRYSITLITLVAFVFILDFIIVKENFPSWNRIHRVIWNVDRFAKKLTQESIMENPEFQVFVFNLKRMTKPPYIIFYDKSNLDILLNHICNLRYFNGAVERLATISFDSEAEREFRLLEPTIPTVTIDITDLKNSIPADLENHKYVFYQLILLVRARIVAALASNELDFWAMQQDSIWIYDFGSMNVEDQYPDGLMLFDTVGNDQVPEYNRMKGWICGSTFFVRRGPISEHFFRLVAHIMTRRQSPDSSIMTYLCGASHYKCKKLPRSVITSSDYFLGNRNMTPAMIQVDYSGKMSKMQLFENSGFVFRNPDGRCNFEAVRNLRQAIRTAIPEKRIDIIADQFNEFENWYYSIKELIGLDPFNNRRFLRVHETLV